MQGDKSNIGKVEQELAYEIESQQAGRDINQAGRDIIIVHNLPATAGPELKKANLEMLADNKRIYIYNRGPATADDIKVIIDNIPEDADAWNGFPRGDLPFRKSLRPGQKTQRLWCGPCFGGPRSINYRITWKNEDGTLGEIEENDFRLF